MAVIANITRVCDACGAKTTHPSAESEGWVIITRLSRPPIRSVDLCLDCAEEGGINRILEKYGTPD